MKVRTFVQRGFFDHTALFTALVFLVVTGAYAQVTNCTSAPSGLVSWWRAELDGHDAVGTNNGALHAGVTFTNGEVGQAFRFDGTTNGYIEVPDAPELHLTNELTIEFWVKRQRLALPAPPYADYIIEKGGDWTGNQNNYSANLKNASYNYCLAFVFGGGWRGGGTVGDITTWHHCAITASNGDPNPTLYVDGVARPVVYSQGALIMNLYPSTRPLHIGAQLDPSTNLFYYSDILVDELSVYNRVLSAAEIQAIYQAGAAGKCLPPPTPPTITSQPADTTVYAGTTASFAVSVDGTNPFSFQWYFNGDALTNATTHLLSLPNVTPSQAGTYFVVVTNPYGTVTSSNATLTVRTVPCVAPPPGLVSWWRAETNGLDNWDSNDGIGSAYYGPGKVGQAFVDPFVIVPDSPALHLTNALTLQAWVNPLTVTGATQIISKFDSNTGSQSSFWLGTIGNGLLSFQVSGTGSQPASILTGPLLPLNQWSFIVATYDGAALRLYVNGTLAAQRAYSGGIFPGTQNLFIGGFSGSIDEVCIYNRALSDNEILGVYGADLWGMCLQPPAIVAQPQSQAVPLGEDVMFSVGVQGNRPLRYQWYFNSGALARATDSSLLLERIGTNQAGAYSVSITNSVGFAQSASANLTLLPAATCTHAPDGMISWWPANHSGMDIVGTNSALLSQGATYATGKVNLAFVTFTNTHIPNGLIEVADSPSLNFGSNADFSIEAWVKAIPYHSDGVPPPQVVAIVEKRWAQPLPRGPGYTLTLNEGRLAFWLSTSAMITNPPFIAGGPDLRDAMFHHLAVTVQRSVTNGGRLYVDGQPVLAFDTTSPSQRGSLSNTFPLYIGSGFLQTAGEGRLCGYVDELAIYNRALSADEIMAIRTAGAAGKCDQPPLVTSFLTKGLQDEPLAIPTYRFTLFGYDPDGDPLSLFSVTSPSQGGRPVVLGTNRVTYTPAAGYLGQDSFTYTISDGHGGRTSATALVLIEPRMFAAATIIAPSPPGPAGLQLSFSGYAERTYTIQRAEYLEGPWTDLGTAITDAGGLANFTDRSPPPVCAYYRAIYRSPALPLGESQPANAY